RPAPYICSEWDFGGLPAWLLADRDMTIRSSEPDYLAAVERYYSHLIPEFRPYLATNGGPVIAVTIENEYGSYGNDHAYLSAIEDMLRRGGVDVPLYTTDGDCDHMLTFGRSRDDLFFGVNYRAKPGTSAHAERKAHQIGADKPFFIGEFWAGRSMHWGEPFRHRPPEETADALREALALGGNVCFYMFAGGTNFGFMGGANIGCSYSPRPGTPSRYIPHTTSYSEDTMIGEGGELTEKYFLCRDVLDEYFGREKRPHVYNEHPTQAGTVALTETASLFDNLDALTETRAQSAKPKPMEDYGQSYGLILYSTKLNAFEMFPVSLQPYKYRDRANLYVDDAWFATFLRDRGATKIADGVETAGNLPLIRQTGTERKIDVLVENIGRVNFGKDLPYERKGMEECLLYSGVKLFGYDTQTLPLRDLSGLSWQTARHTDHKPCFFRGSFDAKPGVDTYVSFENLGHGYIWVNGINLGRYDSAGPQMTLYLPGHFLKESGNELIVLDIDPVGER
ncbi:MAG: beta-galactosidase, partial [Clostridia bacterium]|nr:beta-galactosidase [Clostridia bacterium]